MNDLRRPVDRIAPLEHGGVEMSADFAVFNPWVSAATALWLASSRGFGLLKALAEAAGSAPVSIRDAARRLRT